MSQKIPAPSHQILTGRMRLVVDRQHLLSSNGMGSSVEMEPLAFPFCPSGDAMPDPLVAPKDLKFQPANKNAIPSANLCHLPPCLHHGGRCPRVEGDYVDRRLCMIWTLAEVTQQLFVRLLLYRPAHQNRLFFLLLVGLGITFLPYRLLFAPCGSHQWSETDSSALPWSLQGQLTSGYLSIIISILPLPAYTIIILRCAIDPSRVGGCQSLDCQIHTSTEMVKLETFHRRFPRATTLQHPTGITSNTSWRFEGIISQL